VLLLGEAVHCLVIGELRLVIATLGDAELISHLIELCLRCVLVGRETPDPVVVLLGEHDIGRGTIDTGLALGDNAWVLALLVVCLIEVGASAYSPFLYYRF